MTLACTHLHLSPHFSACILALLLWLCAVCVLGPEHSICACLLQQKYGLACPGNETVRNQGKTVQITYVPIKRGAPGVPAPGPTVEYAALSGLGWNVSSERYNSTTWTSRTSDPVDFWSVMCESYDDNNNRAECDTPGKFTGLTHVRYDCDGAMWILTYALRDATFQTTPDDMWANFDCGACSDGNDKELLFSSSSSSGCNSVCMTIPPSCTAAGSCTVCCNNMWRIVENDVWIGWMAKASYNRAGANFAWDTLVVHWDGGGVGGATGQTISSTGDRHAWGVCMNCTGEPLLRRP